MDFNLSICEKKLHDIKIAKEEARKMRNPNREQEEYYGGSGF